MEKIISIGRKKFENTEAFKLKKRKLRKMLKKKYSKLIDNEPVFLKKIILKVKYNRELRKELQKINPLENLYNQ